MFTPFAFIQPLSLVLPTPGIIVNGYYIGGDFNTYATNTNPYFRVLDSSGSQASNFNQGDGLNGTVYTYSIQSDDKLVLGGIFLNYSGSSQPYITRINTNGTRDTTFNIGTGFNSGVVTLGIDSLGRIIAGGSLSSYSGSTQNRITRINSNGTRDTTFNIGTGFNGSLSSLSIQTDNKIIASGAFTSYSGSSSGATRIIRLNTDGTRDTTYNVGTSGLNGQANYMVSQSDGKVIAVGNFTSYSGSSINRIVRLNTNGTLDTTFNIGTGFNSEVNSLAIQSDDKVIVVGNFTSYSGSNINRIVRLNTNGTLDTTFNIGTGIGGVTPTVDSIGIQSDGKILIQGQFTSYSGSLAVRTIRLNTDGTVDTSFNHGINSSTRPNIILQLPNNNIVVGGNFTGNNIDSLTFLNTTGSTTSNSIIASNGFWFNIRDLKAQTDGKIITGGTFTYYSGSSRNYITRINPNGSIDASFNIGNGFNSTVNSLTLQTDGKIIAGGSFTSYSGSTQNRITRINSNGTRDTTFSIGTGFGGGLSSLSIQTDNKIIAGGDFTSYSGSNINRIVRLNTSGTIDATFNVGTGFNNTVNALAIDSSNRIIAGGALTSYSGSNINRIVRINTNGTLDTTFNIGTGFGNNSVTSLAIQTDGKIIAGGSFTSYSGSSTNRIIRLNTNGTIDATFNVGSGANGEVSNITLDPETQKILIGGGFTTYSGSTVNRIARLNTNGTIDTTFVPTGSGFNNVVRIILPYIY
jgi:uncharacterized delta-60 repeat protein